MKTKNFHIIFLLIFTIINFHNCIHSETAIANPRYQRLNYRDHKTNHQHHHHHQHHPHHQYQGYSRNFTTQTRRDNDFNTNRKETQRSSSYHTTRRPRNLQTISMHSHRINNQWKSLATPATINRYDRDDVETFSYDNNNWPQIAISTSTTTTTTTTKPPRSSYSTTNYDDDGRNICMQEKIVNIPVKTRKYFTRPVYRTVPEPCNNSNGQIYCTKVHVFHDRTYHDVISHKPTKQITYDCCKGWTRQTRNATDCLEPICRQRCYNNGRCIKPDTCQCPSGYTGQFCERDVNECDNKPCDQFCYNTNGSYYCRCREGFLLHSDMQSCKKIVTDDRDTAFEARDLENDIDSIGNSNSNNDVLLVSNRVHHIEKILENERIRSHDLEKNLQTLKARLSSLEYTQKPLQETLNTYSLKTRKLENLINILIRCRKDPKSESCP